MGQSAFAGFPQYQCSILKWLREGINLVHMGKHGFPPAALIDRGIESVGRFQHRRTNCRAVRAYQKKRNRMFLPVVTTT